MSHDFNAGATRGQVLGKGDEAVADERKMQRKYGKLAGNKAIQVDDSDASESAEYSSQNSDSASSSGSSVEDDDDHDGLVGDLLSSVMNEAGGGTPTKPNTLPKKASSPPPSSKKAKRHSSPPQSAKKKKLQEEPPPEKCKKEGDKPKSKGRGKGAIIPSDPTEILRRDKYYVQEDKFKEFIALMGKPPFNTCLLEVSQRNQFRQELKKVHTTLSNITKEAGNIFTLASRRNQTPDEVMSTIKISDRTSSTSICC